MLQDVTLSKTSFHRFNARLLFMFNCLQIQNKNRIWQVQMFTYPANQNFVTPPLAKITALNCAS